MAPPTENNDSTAFLKTVTEVLGWTHLDGDFVIDIGCGVGSTSKAIVEFFPGIRKVVAIDILEQRLQNAEITHSDPKIVYELADIRNKLSLARWVGEMDKAVSVFCFNCVEDVRKGYENMFCLLKPGGEAALLQSLQSGYYDYLNEIKDSPKWRNYFKGRKVVMPLSHFEKHSAFYYMKMLEEVGFEIVSHSKDVNLYERIFTSEEDCKHGIFNTCQLTDCLPEDKKAEFMDDSFHIFIKYNRRNDQGFLRLEHTTFSAFVRKPKTAPAGLLAPASE